MRAWAPGRVNLIGEHTDYTGGLALPMAVDLGTAVDFERGGDRLVLRSADLDGELDVALPVGAPDRVTPDWGRYPAAVAAELGAGPGDGLVGTVHSTVPLGSGLSSSAALEVATALALGDRGTPLEVARRCQRAETAATGVPCGIMDQLASAAGVEGHALLLDCEALTVTPTPVPASAAIWVVHSGRHRALAGSAYAERRAQCEAAAEVIGPLRHAAPPDVARIGDPVVAARARHVISENARVLEFAAALAAGALADAGRIMLAGHASLRHDFEVSTPELDDLVDRLCGLPGVYGARLTGAGFGGCVVALADPEVELSGEHGCWRVRPSAGARLVDTR